MIVAKLTTVRDLIREQLPDNAKILFTREMADGYLAIYTVGEDADFHEHAAFFSRGQDESGELAVMHEWDKLCEME